MSMFFGKIKERTSRISKIRNPLPTWCSLIPSKMLLTEKPLITNDGIFQKLSFKEMFIKIKI